MKLSLESSYARLPANLYARVSPTPVASAELVKVNRPLAEDLGLDADELSKPAAVQVFAGNTIPEGAEPLALAYAGHQFGNFVRLGDGRAVLLGELVDPQGRRRDVQLKGAGRTPFSRGGDGRAALGPVLREYVVSEAMAALGVPTTRALAAVTTGESVYRETALPGAILTRIAASHIRVGTFELLAATGDREALVALSDYALNRHYPEAAGSENAALSLLEGVIESQSSLVARWLGLGFVHGVMNTDNMAISGETIDYGPCAFLDEYDPGKTFSSIDHQGRYAYGNQPRIAAWNIARLAEALLPLLAANEADAIEIAKQRLETFASRFEVAYGKVVRAKLGFGEEEPNDFALAQDLLGLLAADGVDFTIFFRGLSEVVEDSSKEPELLGMFAAPAAVEAWLKAWRARLERDRNQPEESGALMRNANPAFIPRNHRIEQAISAAVQRGDYQPFETLLRVLSRPYDAQAEETYLAEAPEPEERVLRTFCGT